ncbi:cytochrome protein [Penicillium coprophilum]|uniref:cytochrome protein n=1 Tax=Penicillium coprophilum TaxID=36646 RepID=UPI002394FEF3|nr:cytochrome protein [Penicillium coprophilum]KAJ5154383.1 cytochrome protein [Penicillium coprophilum]
MFKTIIDRFETFFSIEKCTDQQNYVLLVLSTVLAYILSLIFYRLYLHPLHRFPGPKLAAISTLYEVYFDYVHDGQFVFQMEKMHQKYVRITPREIHISDPEFYERIYAGGSKIRDKDPVSVRSFNMTHSLVATIGHDLHQSRHRVMGSYFSRQSIKKREPTINYCIQKLLERFKQAQETGECITLNHAFTAMTGDIITKYSFGKDFSFLEANDYKSKWKSAVAGSLETGKFFRYFPLLDVYRFIPSTLAQALNPGMGEIFYIEDLVRNQVRPLLSSPKHEAKTEATIFSALLNPAVPAEEKTLDRLTDQGHMLLVAGTETTANTLTMITFQLLKNPAVLACLREELKVAMPTPASILTWNSLEKLPFLNGVIQEGLRLSLGVSSRLPRVAPNDNLQYNDWVIPAGTPVSTATYFVHMNSSIFPNPEKFDPQRWITASEKGLRLEKYIVAFTKGSRQCLGMSLAYAELYLTVAALFRQLDMELYDTSDDDCSFIRDCVIPASKRGSKGVRVIIKGSITQ